MVADTLEFAVGAGKSDGLCVRAEELALERVREAGREVLGLMEVFAEEEEEGGEAVGGGGWWCLALDDEIVVAVEGGRGFLVDGAAGEEEGGDVAVVFQGGGMVGVLRLVADVLLNFSSL